MAISSIEQLESFRSRGPVQKLTLAAEELHVTPGAVSRQIKALRRSSADHLYVLDHHLLSVSDRG